MNQHAIARSLSRRARAGDLTVTAASNLTASDPESLWPSAHDQTEQAEPQPAEQAALL